MKTWQKYSTATTFSSLGCYIYSMKTAAYIILRWLEIVFEIFSTRKRFTFIYIIAAFNVAT